MPSFDAARQKLQNEYSTGVSKKQTSIATFLDQFET